MIERQEIEQYFRDFEQAFNRHDPVKMSSFWADECDHVDVDGTYCGSRQEVEKAFRNRHVNGPFSHSNLKLKLDKVRPLGPDFAAVSGTWQLTGLLGPDGEALPTINGQVFEIYTREHGRVLVKFSRPFVPFMQAGGQVRAAA